MQGGREGVFVDCKAVANAGAAVVAGEDEITRGGGGGVGEGCEHG